MQEGIAAQLPPLVPARDPAVQECKHRAIGTGTGLAWGQGGGWTQLCHHHAPAVGWHRDPGGRSGLCHPSTFQALAAAPRLRCYLVWVRWEAAVPDRRLRPEANQEPGASGRAPLGLSLTHIPGDTAGPPLSTLLFSPSHISACFPARCDGRVPKTGSDRPRG